ncbi:Hypothetical protein GSB_152498, partial [Giardia duodenalis]
VVTRLQAPAIVWAVALLYWQPSSTLEAARERPMPHSQSKRQAAGLCSCTQPQGACVVAGGPSEWSPEEGPEKHQVKQPP